MSGVADAVQVARAEGRAALVPFLPAAFPDPTRFRTTAEACVRAGADVLEIGTADQAPAMEGDFLRAAFVAAARAGDNVRRRCVAAAAALAPVVAMSHQPSRDAAVEFAARCAEDGADDVLVPGLPLDEQLALAGAVSPGVGVFVTRRDHLPVIVTASPPPAFVYLQSARQRTGQPLDTKTARTRVRDVRAVLRGTDIPFLVGFGIERPEDAAVLAAEGADGIVVGSAVVRRAQEGPAAVEELVAALVGALLVAGCAS